MDVCVCLFRCEYMCLYVCVSVFVWFVGCFLGDMWSCARVCVDVGVNICVCGFVVLHVCEFEFVCVSVLWEVW